MQKHTEQAGCDDSFINDDTQLALYSLSLLKAFVLCTLCVSYRDRLQYANDGQMAG